MPEPLGIFADLVASLAPAVGGSVAVAAYLIGFAIVFAVTLAMLVALDSTGPIVLLMATGVGICFVVGVGLWDLWTIVFIGLMFAWLIMNPLAGTGGD